jgi:hypothetical protein
MLSAYSYLFTRKQRIRGKNIQNKKRRLCIKFQRTLSMPSQGVAWNLHKTQPAVSPLPWPPPVEGSNHNGQGKYAHGHQWNVVTNAKLYPNTAASANLSMSSPFQRHNELPKGLSVQEPIPCSPQTERRSQHRWFRNGSLNGACFIFLT